MAVNALRQWPLSSVPDRRLLPGRWGRAFFHMVRTCGASSNSKTPGAAPDAGRLGHATMRSSNWGTSHPARCLLQWSRGYKSTAGQVAFPRWDSAPASAPRVVAGAWRDGDDLGYPHFPPRGPPTQAPPAASAIQRHARPLGG